MAQELLLDDRARKVMQYASQEAFSRNHGTIMPEHILLGILKEGTGLTESVLNAIDRDFRRIRRPVDQRLPMGPDEILAGRLPHSDETVHVLEHSRDEAASANLNWVTPAHLLLGITRLPEGTAKEVLEQFGISAAAIRHDIKIELESGYQ